jgi:threo-3-hydroxy-L-aspartate ammonia-lyase
VTEIETYLAEHAKEIEAAAGRIAPFVRRTPSLTTDLDGRLVLKPECFQVTGSFKARGAFNAMLKLKDEHPDTNGVIAVSSGNHAQALALAARTVGIPAVILIPNDANPAKVAATRAYGAEVIQEGVTFDNREQRMREVRDERGLTLVHPFDNWDIIHGAGTAARELLQDHPDLEAIVTPVGGGGLFCGTALAAKAHNRDIKVIGVEPEAADDARRTVEARAIQTLDRSPTTIADGVRTVSIGQRNFEVMVEKGLIDEIVTVGEPEIQESLLTSWTRLKLALEPTGALPLAAYEHGMVRTATNSGKVGLILSGGNANLQLVSRLLREAVESRQPTQEATAQQR